MALSLACKLARLASEASDGFNMEKIQGASGIDAESK